MSRLIAWTGRGAGTLAEAAGRLSCALPAQAGGRAGFWILCGLVVLWLGWIEHIRSERAAELVQKSGELRIMAAALLGNSGDAVPAGIGYEIFDTRGAVLSGNLASDQRSLLDPVHAVRNGIVLGRYARDGRIAIAVTNETAALASWRADGIEEAAALLIITALAIGLASLIVALGRSQRVAAAARAEAEAANQVKGAFLASMSHELRTPLNAVFGFAQVLRADERLSRPCREMAERIADGAAQSVQLLADILDFAKIEAGQLSVSDSAVPLKPVIDSAVGLLRPQAEAAGLHLSVEIAEPSLSAWADPMRLRQVVLNLLSNAIKYNRPDGCVRVEVGLAPENAGAVRVAVRDGGIGIPPERHSELFQPFRRLGAEASGIEGSGLGLNISRQLVGMMGGRIGWDSAPARGSLFWAELRRADPPPIPIIHSPRPRTAAGRLRVLYLEDNPLNVAVMRQILTAEPGLTLAIAASGGEGVALARAHRPDLILADLHLPDMDGYEVLRRLRAEPETCAIPVIAVTADAGPEDVNRALTGGFAEHLPKPVELERVRALLDRFDCVSEDEWALSPRTVAAAG